MKAHPISFLKVMIPSAFSAWLFSLSDKELLQGTKSDEVPQREALGLGASSAGRERPGLVPVVLSDEKKFSWDGIDGFEYYWCSAKPR